MLRTTIIATLLGLSSLATAAPTRTQCRCIIVDSDSSEPLPASPIAPSSRRPDICSSLGSELEYMQHVDPELYSAFVSQAQPTPSEKDLRPLSTAVLMKLSSKNGLELPSAPTGRPSQNIICRSVPEAFSGYHDSQATLIILQIIVALGILGCIAEGISLLSDWLERKPEETLIRLPGSEKRLRAFSTTSASSTTSSCCSEKSSLPLDCRIDMDGADDEDDEMNRPVM